MASRTFHHRFCSQLKLLFLSLTLLLFFCFAFVLLSCFIHVAFRYHCFTLSVRMSTIIKCFNNIQIELANFAVMET